MSKLVNIKLLENYMLDPSFAELIQTLALRHPLYTFGLRGVKSDELEWRSGTAPKFKAYVKPEGTTEETRFVSFLNVHSGSELLGTLSMEVAYSNGGRVPRFILDAWRLGEREGTSSRMLKTTKPNVALRTFKKFFVPRAMLEAYKVASEELLTGFHKSIATLKRSIEHAQFAPTSVDMQRYIYLTLNNLFMDPAMRNEVTKVFFTTKYVDAMAKWTLSRDMELVELHAVIAHNGGYLYKEPTQDLRMPCLGVGPELPTYSELQHLTYEEMPESLKNNVAVLQMCKDNELIRDVGYRHSADLFLVMPT